MKTCLINCHFGKLPEYLPFFIKSASTIKYLDFYIATNDDFSSYVDMCRRYGIVNVNFIKYDISDLENTVSSKLGVDYKMPSVRKICDWKTAYTFLFSDIVKDYEYWGHCDLDVIFGDVDSYLEPLLDNYSIISGDCRRLCGPFTIYQSIIGHVWKCHHNWAHLMLECDHVAYDESGLDVATKNTNLRICYGQSIGRKMQNYGSPHLSPPLRIPATWQDGTLTIDEDGRETMFIHMGHKNQITETEFHNKNFKINQRGFSYE